MKKTIYSILAILAGILFISSTNAAGIGDVVLRFCNGTGTLEKTLNLKLDANQNQEICMEFSNQSKEDVEVNLGIVDCVITNDSYQKKACKNEWDKAEFWQYVTYTGTSLKIPANKSVRETASIKFPDGKNGWEVHGCVTYSVANQVSNWEMFSIMVRKANFVDVILSGNVILWLHFIDLPTINNNLSKNPKIGITYDKESDTISAQTTLENKGSVSETVTITGTIKSLLGTKTFVTETRTIFPNQTSTITSTIDSLPRYKGKFTISYKVSHLPASETDQTKTETIPTETTSFWIINILAASVLGWFIVLIWIISILIKKITSLSKLANTKTTNPIIKKVAKSASKKIIKKKK